MLPSLEIFKNIPCPDLPHCQRPQCIFSHEQQTSSTSTNASIPSKRARPCEQQQNSSNQSKEPKKVIVKPKPNESIRTSPINKDPTHRVTHGTTVNKKNTSNAKPNSCQASKPSPINKDPTHRIAHVATFTGPPTIKADISSHTALKIRQTISNKLYEQYSRIYPDSTQTAARNTQEQEKTILASTMNTAGYKQQAMSTLMQLKKRPVESSQTETSESESFIDSGSGSFSGVESTSGKTTKQQQQQLDVDPTYLNTLILTNDQLDAMQYPPHSLLKVPISRPEKQQKQQQTCDRCKKPYMVKALLDAKDVKACQYHCGRLRVSKSFGEKLRTYTCCDDTLGSIGCEKGPHVFKDEQVDKLHASIAFIKVPTSPRKEKILALDCEMGYTTIGMELIRLTVINAKYEKVLDELVLPSHMVIDLNTRYSGITTLAGVKHNLVSIRQALFDLMDPDTILLGHGLENDLKALRIIHDKVIDTAALYPHPHGLPYRYGLRALATRYLSKFIQTGSDGHDSFEDAGTCLELLHEYLRKHNPSSLQ